MSIWKKDSHIYTELLEVEKHIGKALKSRQSTLTKGVEGLLEAGGKRVRPALVLLSGQFGEYDRKKLMPLAAGVEILHMATLVHDDIIDDADIRRGAPTIQAKWGKDMAVFTGDFLLTRAFSLITQNVELESMHKLSNVLKAICEGEIDQYEARFDLDTSVGDYLKRIARKTALLFTASCRLGAEQSHCTPRNAFNLRHYGQNLGMAFQIKDDLLDFSDDQEVLGKPSLADFANGIFTLPIIYLARKEKYRSKLVDIINSGEFLPEELLNIKNWVHESGAIEYTKALAKRYMDRALNNLSALPPIPARDSMEHLAMELRERDY
ncbi:MAG: polyprenyl synthetase family protein [Clostridiales bacterium]|nr:polyprenyl synthetase family protein [Clostridiales bacterium]